QRRPLPGARPRDRLRGHVAHGEHVVPVCDDAREAVARRPVGEVRDPRRRGRGRRDRPLVVLAHEHDRRVEHGREVARLVQDPLVGGSVPEETGDDAVAALQAQPVRGADGERARAADDRVRAEHALLHRRDVHAAAAPPAVAVLAADDLRHHPPQVETLGDTVTVAAVGARDQVVGTERRADTDGDRLHADVRVHRAADELLLEQLHRAQLEAADPPHGEEQLLQLLHRRRRRGWDGHPRYVSSAITASTAPTRTSSPSAARIDSTTPETGDSTSWLAFSASISTITSPRSTVSPARFSQRVTRPYSI